MEIYYRKTTAVCTTAVVLGLLCATSCVGGAAETRYMLVHWHGFLRGATFSDAAPLLLYTPGRTVSALPLLERSQARPIYPDLSVPPVHLEPPTLPLLAARGLAQELQTDVHAVTVSFRFACGAGLSECTSDDADTAHVAGIQIHYFDAHSGAWIEDASITRQHMAASFVLAEPITEDQKHAIIAPDGTAIFNNGLPLGHGPLCLLPGAPAATLTTRRGSTRTVHLTSDNAAQQCSGAVNPFSLADPHAQQLVPKIFLRSTPPDVRLARRPDGARHLALHVVSVHLYHLVLDMENGEILSVSSGAGSTNTKAINPVWALAGPVASATFEPALDRIVVASGRELYLLDYRSEGSKTLLFVLPDAYPADARFGRRYVSSDGRTLYQAVHGTPTPSLLAFETHLLALDVSGASGFPVTTPTLVCHDVMSDEAVFFVLPLLSTEIPISTPSAGAPSPAAGSISPTHASSDADQGLPGVLLCITMFGVLCFFTAAPERKRTRIRVYA